MKRSIFKFIYLLILVCSCAFILNACTKQEEDTNVTVIAEQTSIMLGDTTQLTCVSSKFGNYLYTSSDESIATVDEFGLVYTHSEGDVTIYATLQSDPSYKGEIVLTVTQVQIQSVKITGVKAGEVGDELSISYITSPKNIEYVGTYTNENPELVSITQSGKSLKVNLKKEGIATITLTFNDPSSYTYTFNIGICKFDKIVVDGSKSGEDGEIINYNGDVYYLNYTYVNTLKEAFNNITDDGDIYVLPGEYKSSCILKKNNVRVLACNHDKDLFNTNWTEEVKFSDSIVIDEDVSGFTIKGFTFTKDAQIYFNGNNDYSTVSNNKFVNITTSQSWRKQAVNACVYLNYTGAKTCYEDFTLTNNLFKDIANNAFTFNYVNSMKVTYNVFENFALDAIHGNGNDVLGSGQFLIRGNTFKNGGYNGIYFYYYGPKVVSYNHLISIFDNTFENIGNENKDNEYNGAIAFDDYCGGTCSITVRYNEFTNNSNNIHLDNACIEKFQKYLSAYVNYNLFNDVNCETYFKNTTDSQKYSSSVICNFDYNAYANATSAQITYKTNGAKSVANNISKDEYLSLNKVYGTNVIYLDMDSLFIAEDENVTWKSDDNTILDIDSKGLASPKKLGSAKILAYKNNQVIASYDVEVKDSINIDYASLLVQIALNEEGYVEGSNNYTKYGIWYGETHGKEFEHGAWCAMFVSWCANQANIPTTIIPEYALCSAGKQWFESRGLFQYKESYYPKTGDIIFFLSDGAGHTGIVVDYRNGTVYTIEGNTSDACHQRNYSPNYHTITGYGTPAYPVYNGTKLVFDVSSSTDGANHKTT